MAKKLLIAMFITLSCSAKSYAMMDQTQSDLTALEDVLQYKISENESLKSSITPMMVAPPKHLWEESRTDFSPAVWSVLKKIWNKPSELIQCQDCNMQRLHVSSQHTLTMDQGEMTSADLISLSKDPRYQGVKSVGFVTETASGIEIKIIQIQDGAILFQYLADGRKTLNDAKPRLGLAKELERRERGESLTYVFIDLGFYPNGLVHVSFLEQWGRSNQHITGLTLSIINPTLAVGVNYRYMLPVNRRISLSGHLFFPLQSAISTSQDVSKNFAGNVAVHYAFSSTFGCFLGAGSDGGVTAGISMYNPIWFPFLL